MSSRPACERKVKYTKAEAKRERKRRRSRGGVAGKVYHCEHCGFYHLSSWPRAFPTDQELARIEARKERTRQR